MPNPGPTYYGGPPPESGCWKLDTVGLQDYIDQQIAGQSFGDSVDVFWFAFELADLLGWGCSSPRTANT
jgi:hypothetical protein